MHVAEGEGGHIAAVLAEAEPLRHAHAVGRRGIQLFVDLRGMAVLLAADRADLDLQHRMRADGFLEQLRGDVQVLLQRHSRAVPHMRLERRLFAALDLFGLVREQRADPAVQVLLGAMVGVQRDRDVRVALRHLVRECGERERPDRHLDDAVGLGLGESLQRGVERLRAGHVDRGIGVSAVAGGIQHFGIAFGSCDSHGFHYPAAE